MDLGFAGLIEKIEERFGRLITNLLLAVLVFLIFVWAFETLVSLYVSGKNLWDTNGNAILGFFKIVIVLIVLIAVTFIVCYTIIQRIKQKAILKATAIINDHTIKLKSEIEELGSNKVKEIRALVKHQKSK